MGWRVVYINESEYLSLHLNNLKVQSPHGDTLLPLKDIHTLILDNYKITISVHLLNAIVANNVNLVICGVDHLPKGILLPLSGSHDHPRKLREQIKWDDGVKMALHKKIVRSKILNQKRLLEHVRANEEVVLRLEEYAKDIEPGDPTNREGLAAKVYFRAMYGKEFRRFEDDVMNHGLNYGYSILRSQVTKVLVGKGLHTALGLFHYGPNNPFNLSDDIIEPLRPIMDVWVYNNLQNEQILIRDHRFDLIRQTTKKIKIKGTYQTIFNAIAIYVDSILLFIETGKVDDLHFPELDYNEL